MWYNIAMKKEIIRELTETQYLKTMGNPMKNITDDHLLMSYSDRFTVITALI